MSTPTASPARGAPSLLHRQVTTMSRRPEWRAILLLLVIIVVAAITQPIVLSSYEVTLDRAALIGLVALGLTAVILMGELDLSVASTSVLAGVVMASIDDMAWGVCAGLAVGLVVGAVNAFLVVKVGINSFIATLGMLFVLRGLAFVLSDESPVPISNIDAGISFGMPLFGPVTPRLLVFALAFVALQMFVTRVRPGRELYAVGGNRQAARDVGIPVARRVLTGFLISGFVSALAGIIDTLERTAADPTAGSDLLLSSFAAAIIGGIALKGGRGSVLGTMIGALSLGMLQVTLTFAAVQADVQSIFIGGVLLVAVITDPASLRAVAVNVGGLMQQVRGLGRRSESEPSSSMAS